MFQRKRIIPLSVGQSAARARRPLRALEGMAGNSNHDFQPWVTAKRQQRAAIAGTKKARPECRSNLSNATAARQRNKTTQFARERGRPAAPTLPSPACGGGHASETPALGGRVVNSTRRAAGYAGVTLPLPSLDKQLRGGSGKPNPSP